MMAALIRGATIDTILSSFTCEGSPLIRDALVIPSRLDEVLVARLGRTPDERHRNWMLFHFLSYRASDAVFTKSNLMRDGAPDTIRTCGLHLRRATVDLRHQSTNGAMVRSQEPIVARIPRPAMAAEHFASTLRPNPLEFDPE
jgi:hypothetical protein